MAFGRLCYPTCARERSSAFDLDARATIAADVLSRPLGLGFLPDGNLLVVLITWRLILNFGAENQTIHADLANAGVGY